MCTNSFPTNLLPRSWPTVFWFIFTVSASLAFFCFTTAAPTTSTTFHSCMYCAQRKLQFNTECQILVSVAVWFFFSIIILVFWIIWRLALYTNGEINRQGNAGWLTLYWHCHLFISYFLFTSVTMDPALSSNYNYNLFREMIHTCIYM